MVRPKREKGRKAGGEKRSTPRERARKQEGRRETTREIVPAVAEGAATAVVAAATASANPLAAALLAIIPSLVQIAVPFFWRDAQAKLDRWVDRLYRDDPERTPDEVRALYEEKVKNSPAVREAVLRSVNKLLESDEATIDALAAVTADYVRDERPPDRFYRSFLALLSSLSSAEYATLRMLVEKAVAKCGTKTHAHIWTNVDRDDAVHLAPGSADYPAYSEESGAGSVDSEEVSAPHIRRVVQLLRNNLIAERGSTTTISVNKPERGVGGHEDWGAEATIEAETLRRIHRYIR